MERNMKNHSTALRTWVILKDDARARQKKNNPSAYLEHVDARRGDDRLQRRVRLDNAAVVKLVLLDVHPDLLGYLRRFLVLEANLS